MANEQEGPYKGSPLERADQLSAELRAERASHAQTLEALHAGRDEYRAVAARLRGVYDDVPAAEMDDPAVNHVALPAQVATGWHTPDPGPTSEPQVAAQICQCCSQPIERGPGGDLYTLVTGSYCPQNHRGVGHVPSAQTATCGAISRADGLRENAVCVKPKGHPERYHGTTTEDVATSATGYFWYDSPTQPCEYHSENALGVCRVCAQREAEAKRAKIDYAAKDQARGAALLTAFISWVNADDADATVVRRSDGCYMRDEIERLRKAAGEKA